jgi:ADP-dependent NAD(P)H-hydrate dehydratase / NAD(P)H-hydrate epimerase
VLVCALGKTGALATAGTGDVLTGILAAFLAKGLEPALSAAAAAAAQQAAAASVPFQAGLVASDVVAALPQVLSAELLTQ